MEKDLYREMYELETAHWWFRARRSIVLALIGKYLDGPPPPRFLDIGCGTGAMLRELEKMGEAVGMDTSEEALSFARTRTGARLVLGSAPGRLREMEERFDCVLMLDVLEHIEDDLEALKAASGLLKEGGILLATVPAYQWLYAPRDRYHHHLRRYTRRGLREAMAGAGLKIELVSYYNFFLFPAAAVSRLLSRVRGGGYGPDLRLPPPALNKTLEVLLSSERFLLPRFSLPCGLSVISLGRRAA